MIVNPVSGWFCLRKRINHWLGRQSLFQTFADLDEVKDKTAEVRAVRELLDEGGKNGTDCYDGI